jgi:carbon storage regulator
MLILSRKLNESIVIDGRITVKVMRIDGDVIKLGIAAPADVPVHRQEVYEEIRKSNEEAATRRTGSVPKLSTNGVAPNALSHSANWQDRQSKPDTDVKEPKQNKANQVQ